MNKIISFLGVDGAGKTTIAKELVARLDVTTYCYVYLRYYPILSYPIKMLSKITVYKRVNEFINYEQYSKKKKNFSSRYILLTRIYVIICIIDFLIINYVKFNISLLRKKNIIIDRYIIDFLTTISIAGNLNINTTKVLLKYFYKLFPVPDKIIYLNIPLKVALNRKMDIPSEQYLEERKLFYEMLIKDHRYLEIDATKSVDEIIEIIINKIKE